MRIVVIGGSAAGLITSLMLARAGHDVVVVEQDSLAPAADVETAATVAMRATAPQVVQPHILLALCRNLLRHRLPDLYMALRDAGVVEAALATQMPPSLADRSAWPGDEQLTVLMTRRSTVDWVLRRWAAAEPGVTLHGGVRVTGLIAAPGRPPHIVGVGTDHGELTADGVVDAGGRRTRLDRWLVAIGAGQSEFRWAECGLAYYSRQYRLRTVTGLPGLPTTRIVSAFKEFVAGIWGADHNTMLLALAPLAADRRFRGAHHPEVFTAVLRTVPTLAAWLAVLEPISDVAAMGGLHNTLRRLVVAGQPVATGLHAVGDAVCTTNPTFGRGLSLALRAAVDLVDVLDRYPDDPRAQTLAMDDAVTAHIAPWYGDQAAADAALLATLWQSVLGAAPPPATPPIRDRVTFAQIRAAALVDPLAFRAVWTLMGALRGPAEIYQDPQLVARVQEVLRRGDIPRPMAEPSPEQLLTALSTVPTGAPDVV